MSSQGSTAGARGLPGFINRGWRVSVGRVRTGSPSTALANLSPSLCHTRSRVVPRCLLDAPTPARGAIYCCSALCSPWWSLAKYLFPGWDFLLCPSLPLLASPECLESLIPLCILVRANVNQVLRICQLIQEHWTYICSF